MRNTDVGRLALTFQSMAGFPAFFPMLQQGFLVQIPAKASVRQILERCVGKVGSQGLNRIQTLFINGMPVDSMDTAVVRDGDCLALSAAMPGLVGATMRAGGILAGLRQSITYRPPHLIQGQGDGLLRIKLFNLLIKEFGPGFLQRGVWITIGDLQQLIDDIIHSCGPADGASATLDDTPIAWDRLTAMTWPTPDYLIFLVVDFYGTATPKKIIGNG